MKMPINMAPSPLRRQAIDTFQRSRKLPPGQFRDDLRQLAFALWKLHNRGLRANVEIIKSIPEQPPIVPQAASHSEISQSDSIHRSLHGDLQRL
jgi:hypothetical protein